MRDGEAEKDQRQGREGRFESPPRRADRKGEQDGRRECALAAGAEAEEVGGGERWPGSTPWGAARGEPGSARFHHGRIPCVCLRRLARRPCIPPRGGGGVEVGPSAARFRQRHCAGGSNVWWEERPGTARGLLPSRGRRVLEDPVVEQPAVRGSEEVWNTPSRYCRKTLVAAVTSRCAYPAVGTRSAMRSGSIRLIGSPRE